MTLRNGSRGEDVKTVQRYLDELGYAVGRADGFFGRRTANGVADFQDAYLVDGIVDEVTLAAIEAAVGARNVSKMESLMAPPHGLEEIQERFGVIEYEEASGGNIVITNDWAERNIIRSDLPVVGTQSIHRLMEPVFNAVFNEIKAKGLDGKISLFGCWSPRHKMHNPKRDLSTHSWAIACDLNWPTNMPGRVGDLDPEIVATFERHGFNWGGRWRHRDDMHLQLCRGY